MCGEALPDTAGRPTVSSRATKLVHSASDKSQGAICSLCRTAKASPEQHTRRSSRPGPDSRTLEGRHSFATFSIVAARVEGYIIAIDTHIRLLQGWVCQCTLGQGDVIHAHAASRPFHRLHLLHYFTRHATLYA